MLQAVFFKAFQPTSVFKQGMNIRVVPETNYPMPFFVQFLLRIEEARSTTYMD